MPELILLALVSLSAMGLLVFLFLKLNKTQLTLIRLLTDSNQTLINQARTTELTSLAGLNHMTGVSYVDETDDLVSTDARELAAWNAMMNSKGVGDEVYDDDLNELRSGL